MLAVFVSAWNEGRRHGRLQETLVHRQASVKMTHTKLAVSKDGSGTLAQISTLPRELELIGLPTMFRRIELVSLFTDGMGEEEVNQLVADVRSVQRFEHLFIGRGNITNNQVAELVCGISIRRLTVNVESLRESNGRWLTKLDLVHVDLLGETFEERDLELLPSSIKELTLMCSPNGKVDASDFNRFPNLKAIDFYANIPLQLQSELEASRRFNLVIHSEMGAENLRWPP